MEEGWVIDAVMSQSVAQARPCGGFAKHLETISRWTPYKNDISSTVSKVPELLAPSTTWFTSLPRLGSGLVRPYW